MTTPTPKKLAELLAEREKLNTKQAQLDDEIRQAQSLEKKDKIREIKQMMKTYAITGKDLGLHDLSIKPSESVDVSTTKDGKVDKRRGPVKPKYANPNNPEETWTGRGSESKRPKFVKDHLARGGKLEELLIEKKDKVK